MYRVFLGAPSAKDLLESKEPIQYTWTTVSSSQIIQRQSSELSLPPPATLDAASRRISLMYQNVIFGDEEEEQGGQSFDVTDDSMADRDQSTVITWPPTPTSDVEKSEDEVVNAKRSFWKNPSRVDTQFETQESQESQSYNYSDSSSIARFPSFHFSLHSLTSLSVILKSGRKTSSSNKVAMLLAVLEVEGPDTIRTKKGPKAGEEISLLKMILGDEQGSVCKLTAWRETAEAWGGSDDDRTSVKRGDVVLIENVTVSYDPSTSPTLSASPFLKSQLQICYRTMPYTHEDMRLRPDLRLGGSDASVRKVAAVVHWFEKMAGLAI